MSYRTDNDLMVLQRASNEDLALLCDALEFSDNDNKKRKDYRWAATLYLSDNYKRYYPNHCRFFWKEIAEELQKYGGHTGMNWLRGNQGVKYREILIDVCKKQKVKGIDFSNSSTSAIENAFLEKVVELAIEKMSDSDRRQMIEGLKNIEGFGEMFKNKALSKDTLLSVVKFAFKQGGFKSYVLTLQVVNGISKALIGRGLSLGANAALMKYLGSFMSGPWGWAFAAITTLWGFMGPNTDVTIKAVTLVAYIRKKEALGY